MNMIRQITSAKSRQRRFYLVLPLLVLPFLAILFATLGGGRGSAASAQINFRAAGLNLKLPDAHFRKGKEKDKLSLYEEVNRDSAKIKEAMRNDPFYRLEFHEPLEESRLPGKSLPNLTSRTTYPMQSTVGSHLKTSVGELDRDPNADKVMEKLDLLKKTLQEKQVSYTPPGMASVPASYLTGNTPNAHPSEATPELARLEHLVQSLPKSNDSDPEIHQWNSLLDKILLIQHPEKISDSLKDSIQLDGAKTLTASSTSDPDPVSTMDPEDTAEEQSSNAFYGLDEESAEAPHSSAISASVEETQTLVSGAEVRLRLLQEIRIQGTVIPKDQLIYGISSLSNERLKIRIHSIRAGDAILPVSLDVYDQDGLEGIDVPGSLSRDAGKESTNQAISSLGLASLDPSIGAQAANAGIQAAKTLLSRQVKLVRVTIPAGYRVLLRDSHAK
jgi:hypothetical protein